MVTYSMSPSILEVQYAQRLVAAKLLEEPGLNYNLPVVKNGS